MSGPEKSKTTSSNTGKSTPETDKDAEKVDQIGRPTEIGGQKGPEPTRYGDWEKNGRCTDF